MTARQTASTVWDSAVWLLALVPVAFYIIPHTVVVAPLVFGWTDVMAFGTLTIGPYLFAAAACLATLIWWWLLVRGCTDSAVLLGLVTLYIVALTANALCVAHAPLALRQYSLVVSSLGVGLLAARMCGSVERMLALLVAAGAAGAAYGLYYYALRIGVVVSGTVVRAGGLYDDPLEFAYVLIACLPASVYWSTRQRGVMTMAAGIVATAVMLAALILTFSRTALFAAGIAAAFAFVRHASSRRSALKYVITVALICFVAIAFRMLGPDNAISSAGSDSDHAAFLILGMRAFAHNPLTGVGLGNIRWNTDGSNLLVQWLAEFGIGGGLLLAALIVAIIRCLRGRSARITAVGAPLLGIALAGLSDVPFGVVGHPASTCAVGLLLGATMALPAEIRSCRPSVVSERNSSASVGTDDLAEPDKIPVC